MSALLFATLAAFAAPAQGDELITLNGLVEPNFRISMSTADGAPVDRIPAGTYRLVVDDRADIHNFRLSGPDLNVATGVAEVGVTTWTVTLSNGVYLFRCDPHPDMRGWLIVGTAEAPGVAGSTASGGTLVETRGADALPEQIVGLRARNKDAACRTCRENGRHRVPFGRKTDRGR